MNQRELTNINEEAGGEESGCRKQSTSRRMRQNGARAAILTLTAINFLNYADRYVPSAVKSLIQADLHLSDYQTSLPNTGMVMVNLVFAIIFGTMSDKQYFDRRLILFFAIMFWSLATSLAGFSNNLTQLVLIRSLVGVGEAAYGTIAPAMISDFYPVNERNVAYGIYYLAVPLGGALGFGIGAVLGAQHGWRVAFIACGAPGVLAAFMVLRLRDPIPDATFSDDSKNRENEEWKRGSEECDGCTSEEVLIKDKKHDRGRGSVVGASEEESKDRETVMTQNKVNSGTLYLDRKENSNLDIASKRSSKICTFESVRTFRQKSYVYIKKISDEFIEILCYPHFTIALLGNAASNFAGGGLAEWYPTYLLRYSGASLDQAGLLVGVATVLGGIGGNVLGAKVADYYLHKVKSAYFIIPALFTFPSALFMALAVNVKSFGWAVFFLFLCQIFFWTALAPISALMISVIPPRLRARSCGMMIFFSRLGGDVISPPIIGVISDQSGSLQFALQMSWIAALVSGIWWCIGFYFLSPLTTSSHFDETDFQDENSKKANCPTYCNLLCGADQTLEPDSRSTQIADRSPYRKVIDQTSGLHLNNFDDSNVVSRYSHQNINTNDNSKNCNSNSNSNSNSDIICKGSINIDEINVYEHGHDNIENGGKCRKGDNVMHSCYDSSMNDTNNNVNGAQSEINSTNIIHNNKYRDSHIIRNISNIDDNDDNDNDDDTMVINILHQKNDFVTLEI